jgi:predicted KAP-like P-loop ATPase
LTVLSADRPGSNPERDLFGHARFAENLADSIRRCAGTDGLVLALYGPWGSGKSTVLNYVRYYLEQHPYPEQPVIVNFNPWWFAGQENLARAFLGQLQAVLPGKNTDFEKLGDLLADFADGLGGLVDLTGITSGAGKIVGKGIQQAIRKPKDIPALKSKIRKILEESRQKVLILVDDIDRLVADEIRQLFTVIKALADFPNVIYLLAFDREVAVKALENESSLSGARYLEKIIQVPFEIPPVDREALRSGLVERLNEVLAGTPSLSMTLIGSTFFMAELIRF